MLRDYINRCYITKQPMTEKMYKSYQFQSTKQLAGELVHYCVCLLNKLNNVYTGTDLMDHTAWWVCVIKHDRGTNVIINTPVCRH